MGKRRTPSQRAAVTTVNAAAKKLIAEIDKYHDPRWKKFQAFFHLNYERVSDPMECKTTYPDGRVENLPVTIGSKLFASVSGRA